MVRRRTILSAVGGSILLAGCTAETKESSQEELPVVGEITVADGAFTPLTVHVGVGGTVTWGNAGDEAYQIDSYQFHSDSTSWQFRAPLEPGESVTHTFEDEGRFDFTDQSYGQFSICGRVVVGHVDEGSRLPCE